MKPGQTVKLTRSIWGHKPGTKGKVTKTLFADDPQTKVNRYIGQVKFKGSPKMYVQRGDVEECATTIVASLLDHCGHCQFDKELEMGRKVEKEHTDDPDESERIAKDHLKEPGHSRYYTRLKKAGLADELKESQSCECRDPGCPACRGKCNNRAVCNLRRADMMDQDGTFFCDKCAEDALKASVFGGPDVRNFIRYYGRTPRLKAPPKADIMPGGGVGGPAGDSTAIGGGGSASGV